MMKKLTALFLSLMLLTAAFGVLAEEAATPSMSADVLEEWLSKLELTYGYTQLSAGTKLYAADNLTGDFVTLAEEAVLYAVDTKQETAIEVVYYDGVDVRKAYVEAELVELMTTEEIAAYDAGDEAYDYLGYLLAPVKLEEQTGSLPGDAPAEPEQTESLEELEDVEYTPIPTAKPTKDPESAPAPTEAPAPTKEPAQVMLILTESTQTQRLFIAPSEHTPVVALIPAGALLNADTIQDEWANVTYTNAEGETFIGYVPTAKLALYNPELPEDETTLPVRAITLTSNLTGQTVIYEGTIAELTATLIGFEEGAYTVQWQVSEDDVTFTDIPGATELVYSFPVDAHNIRCYYRIVIYDLPELEDVE